MPISMRALLFPFFFLLCGFWVEMRIGVVQPISSSLRNGRAAEPGWAGLQRVQRRTVDAHVDGKSENYEWNSPQNEIK